MLFAVVIAIAGCSNDSDSNSRSEQVDAGDDTALSDGDSAANGSSSRDNDLVPAATCPDAPTMTERFGVPLVDSEPPEDADDPSVMLACRWQSADGAMSITMVASDGAGQRVDLAYDELFRAYGSCPEGRCSDPDDVEHDFTDNLADIDGFVSGDINTFDGPKGTSTLAGMWAAATIGDEVLCVVNMLTSQLHEGPSNGAAAATIELYTERMRPAMAESLRYLCGAPV